MWYKTIEWVLEKIWWNYNVTHSPFCQDGACIKKLNFKKAEVLLFFWYYSPEVAFVQQPPRSSEFKTTDHNSQLPQSTKNIIYFP